MATEAALITKASSA